jgi:hypothetical protein
VVSDANSTEGERRGAWLDGTLDDLVGSPSQYAGIAALLTADPVSDGLEVTVTSAERQLEFAASIRKELSELIMSD